jgi:hypothetical protein
MWCRNDESNEFELRRLGLKNDFSCAKRYAWGSNSLFPWRCNIIRSLYDLALFATITSA